MEQDNDIINETGAVEKIGIVDEPLEKRGEDSLKIKKYSNALVTFIKNSLTPMTIGIQGSWGSGKTSLLNTIYAQLDDANEHEDSKDFKVIWINSWMIRDLRTPFGGMKHSGLGREGGDYILEFFTEKKNICYPYETKV